MAGKSFSRLLLWVEQKTVLPGGGLREKKKRHLFLINLNF
jgi:hypothetical protein